MKILGRILGAAEAVAGARVAREKAAGGLRFRRRCWKNGTRLLLYALGVASFGVGPAYAYDNYQTGHISRVSFVTNGVLIWLDSGLPTNCTGTPSGWMMIYSSSTPIVAFVTGLWMRGDASQVSVTVYTGGLDSTGFCVVGQIDTGGAGG